MENVTATSKWDLNTQAFIFPYSFPSGLADTHIFVHFTCLFLQISIPSVSLVPNSRIFHCGTGQPTVFDIRAHCPYCCKNLLTFVLHWELSIEM